MNWNEINIKLGCTPAQYLKDNYNTLSDAQLSMNLSQLCNQTITRNAVKKCRYRLNLLKPEVLQPNITTLHLTRPYPITSYGN